MSYFDGPWWRIRQNITAISFSHSPVLVWYPLLNNGSILNWSHNAGVGLALGLVVYLMKKPRGDGPHYCTLYESSTKPCSRVFQTGTQRGYWDGGVLSVWRNHFSMVPKALPLVHWITTSLDHMLEIQKWDCFLAKALSNPGSLHSGILDLLREIVLMH